MANIRAFTNPKVCLQRLGFLKPLIWKASLSSTNNLRILGKELISIVSKKVNVSLTPQVKEYIIEGLKSPIYKNIRDNISNSNSTNLEIQDYYLSHEGIPSKTGKLVSDDFDKYPYLAINLGLLRKVNYALLVRGCAFLSIISEDEIRAFNFSSVNGDIVTNPLELTIPQKILLLYSFLEFDGDVLKPLYNNLLSISRTFNILDAGSFLPQIYNEIAKKCIDNQSQDKNRARSLLKVSHSIEKNINKKSRNTSHNSLTHNIIPRLEPFVDLNLLEKTNFYSYNYSIPEKSRDFFISLANSDNIEDFLKNKFFKSIVLSGILQQQCNYTNKIENILPLIIKSYNKLKDPLGYAPISEILLLSGIFNIVENNNYSEISDGIELIMNLRTKYPYEIKFNVDRRGKPTYIKFEKSIYKIIGQ